MKFTRLRLNGFKSFVDPTDLVIAEGLTGVVGPNGCGKSNLLEALRWVMGENRPTAMRGGGMEDVIFAGAATRPARNHAEVTLTVDNGERLAPAAFNDADSLEIIRRITRDMGSAYRLNGKDVRARDVQMLFADASTGSQSPALVRQGQIAELINAKPTARRRILEEAAGISGLYQRRHEAELKLRAAEQNLSRVDDVVESQAAQLATLARQARTAARYREIGEALRRAEGILLWLRWRAAEAGRGTAEAELQEMAQAASRADALARKAAETRAAAETALPPLREEATVAGAVLSRQEAERDRLLDQEKRARGAIRAMGARIEQLDRDAERESVLDRDAGETMRALEAEAAELARAGEGFETRLAQAETQAREAGEVLSELERAQNQRTEDAARLAARHQSAQRLVAEAKKRVATSAQEAERAKSGLEEAAKAATTAEAGTTQAAEAEAAAKARTEAAETALAEAETARGAAQAREAEARAARSGVEGEAKALRAEVAGLARLLERGQGEGEQLLDALKVAPGYEKALGAALGDELKAPVVGPDAATGWAELPGYDADQPLPGGAEPLAEAVAAPGVLARRIAQIGVVEAADGARLQARLAPGQRLVSREGDLWRWDGYRAGAEDAPSAAALRLQQMNRLAELRAELETVEAKLADLDAAHGEALQALEQAKTADAEARAARRVAETALSEAARALSRAEAEKGRAQTRRDAARDALARHEDEGRAGREALVEAEAGMRDLEDLDAARAAVEEGRVAVEGARIAMITRRSEADELRREGQARARRAETVARELDGWRQRADTARTRLEELAQRRSETEAELERARERPEALAEERRKLDTGIRDAEARRDEAAEKLRAAEGALTDAAEAERACERAASEARERRAASEARAEAARTAATQAAERITEARECTPDELLASLETGPEAMPPAEEAEAEIAKLRRQRENLGSVNLRAEEDAAAIREEHDGLVSEKADLEEAIRALRQGIGSLNREGRERLLAAFDQVNENFGTLFTHLFGGGEARLTLVESDDPLEAGLEILCQPPGKKLSVLSLLSGGEQTLTALALIFAVFLANPAPICVLDEVDAPLDDANVTRFCDLLDEMTRRTDTRFLIITHHAVTMARMDRLYGVTMGEQGVSQLVSVDLKKAEQMVA
ncbi:chromosome segregation SMC family protein [Limimaricola pyoseonensis]|uniref:Chromosome partition protein Smc n=1 Tax=Limimaricola pyoseonensis TaxID=521013 RepID=A0A1G7F5J5_9RHOB|nr:AAA family ATPase [Limimaricola pyoseonensis]SDE71188.1 condensin subunit Smc [Limimaricola pyoseonensis]